MRDRVGHVLVHLGRDALVVEGTEGRVRREGIAESKLARSRLKALDELVVRRLLDQDALAGGAALPGA